jgi:(p)ppGpp synthase/HD superfamily hydrolase
MPSTPLRPPSLEEAGEALTRVAPQPLAWPTVFDAPATVERVWLDFVAELPEPERRALATALAFARARHADQTRRGSDAPYWVHLVRVTMEIARWKAGTQTMLVAALLHDVLEDTGTTPAELRAGFGPAVAWIVDWLTVPPGLPDEEQRLYYRRLAEQGPVGARLLKVADRIDNLRSLQALVMRTGDAHRRWAQGYLERTRWQVMPLAANVPSVARVALVAAMADLAPVVGEREFAEP